jgi:hypothetical protein
MLCYILNFDLTIVMLVKSSHQDDCDLFEVGLGHGQIVKLKRVVWHNPFRKIDQS